MRVWIVIALMTAAGARAEHAWAAKAVCVVCALGGETQEEKVAATRTMDGRELAFCSADCAAKFDQDPYAYVFVPGPAPDLRFVSLPGDTIRTAQLRGKVVIIDFWATWCKPCVKSMPELDALQRKNGGEVVVIGVSLDQGGDREKRVRKFLWKHPVGYAVALDAEADPAWERLRVKVLPSVFVIAPDGALVSRHTGPLSVADLEREVTGLLERPGD